MRELTQEQQTVNAGNPLARFAHRSRVTTAVNLVTRLCGTQGTVVASGEGAQQVLQVLADTRPHMTLIGRDLLAPAHADSLDAIPPRSVDVFTAFEVCEHLRDDELDALLADALRILRPAGALVISVPIMYGLAIVPKVTNWMVRSRSLASEYSGGEMLRAMLGMPVARPANPRYTHKGFDFRDLRDAVSRRFVIDEVHTSPVAFAPWWMSSQYFMICRPLQHA